MNPNFSGIRYVLLEAILIVFGVLIALGLNEWRQNRNQAERAQIALKSIRDEIQSNRDRVTASLEYHRSRIDTLAALRGGSDDRTPSPRLFPKGFIYPAPVLDIAWKSAQTANVVDRLPYPTVLTIARIYAEQEHYNEQARRSGEIIYHELYYSGATAIAANSTRLLSILHTFRFSERRLLAVYNEALAELNGSGN